MISNSALRSYSLFSTSTRRLVILSTLFDFNSFSVMRICFCKLNNLRLGHLFNPCCLQIFFNTVAQTFRFLAATLIGLWKYCAISAIWVRPFAWDVEVPLTRASSDMLIFELIGELGLEATACSPHVGPLSGKPSTTRRYPVLSIFCSYERMNISIKAFSLQAIRRKRAAPKLFLSFSRQNGFLRRREWTTQRYRILGSGQNLEQRQYMN